MFGNQLLDSHSASATITSIGGIPTGLTPGSVVFIGPTTILAEDNPNLFWDDTNNRLGLLTNAPTHTLHVATGGSVRIQDLTPGSVLFAGTSGVVSQDNANLFWDDTNNRLLIGSSGIATHKLEVTGVGGEDIFEARDGFASRLRVRPTLVVVNQGLGLTDFQVGGPTLTNLIYVTGATTERVGIGTATPSSLFSVGATSQFQVGTDGDLDRIKDVPYSWPAANAVGALNNDGAGTLSWAAPAPAAHNVLSASHGDTVANAVTRGSLIYGNSTPAWDELVIGAANRLLRSDGTDVSWAQAVLTTDVTGILPVANGGTGIASGTSGGILGFTAAGTIASSGLLTDNVIVVGGGAGATPNTIAAGLGTTTTVLHGNAAGEPTWAAVSLTADVSGTLPVGNGGTGSTAFTAGSVIFSNGTILTQDNAELFWDDASNFLGIGTATPSEELHVVGDALVTGIVYGGASAGDNLDLDPSSAANYTGGIRLNTTATDYGSANIRSVVLWPNGLTHGAGAFGDALRGITWESTYTVDSSESLFAVQFFNLSATLTNTAGVTGFPFASWYTAAPSYVNAQAVAATSLTENGFRYSPTFSNTGGGSWTVTSMIGYQSSPVTIPAGTTITLLQHYVASAVTVSGTVTTHVGYDCAVNTGGTPISYRSTGALAQMRHAGPAIFGIGTVAPTANTFLEVTASATSSFRNATRTIFPPTANQVIDAAADTILANATFVNLTNTTGAPIVLTSAPTIANGEDGMYLIIMNIAADSISLQDQGTLAGSNLRLGAVARVLGTRDSLILLYSGDIGDWVEVGFNNVI